MKMTVKVGIKDESMGTMWRCEKSAVRGGDAKNS